MSDVPMTPAARGFEVHTHARVTGDGRRSVEHSHDVGSLPHRHAEHGPSHFGYGRERLTKKPTGEQMPHELTESTFTVVVHEESLRRYHADRAAEGYGPVEGGAIPTINRLGQTFHLTPVIERGDA